MARRLSLVAAFGFVRVLTAVAGAPVEDAPSDCLSSGGCGSGGETTLAAVDQDELHIQELVTDAHSDLPNVDIVNVSALYDATEDAEAADAARHLSMAFERTGFAVIVGHPVKLQTITQLRADAYRFFSSDEKYDYDRGKGYGFGGYVRFAESGAQLLGDFSKPPDLVESLTVKGLARLTDGDQENAPGGDEVFGSRDNSMADVPEWMVASVKTFQHQAQLLTPGFARAARITLGVDSDELASIAEVDPKAPPGVRLAHYPDVADPLPGQLRYGAHVDSATFTVLSLDPDAPGGLQVSVPHRDGAVWVDVPFVEGGLVINVGALLSRWTGKKWLASVHRVLNKPGRRVSIVTSALPAKPDGPPFSTFSSLKQEGPPPPPVTAKEFLAVRVALHRPEFAQETGLKTPDDFAKESARIMSFTK